MKRDSKRKEGKGSGMRIKRKSENELRREKKRRNTKEEQITTDLLVLSRLFGEVKIL